MARILIIEDDPKMLKLISSDLELEGYSVLIARDGVEGLQLAKTSKPDLMILDLMMPKMNGYDVCRTLRKEGSDLPIIMLTAKGQEEEKVIGFSVGADDYVTKPFSGMELMARVKALLRRHHRETDKINKTEAPKESERVKEVTFDDVVVDFKKMEATKHGKALALTLKEYQLLELLVRRRGEVISREQFLSEIWGYEEAPTTRTVDTLILTLRQKLSPKQSDAYITTIHGAGYKFTAHSDVLS